MSSALYRQARYYDVAFGFVDIPSQLDRFETLIREHGRRPVQNVLDLCCGPSRQLREFARRGYRAVGLDASEAMLAYLSKEAAREGVAVETVQGDILAFDLPVPVDFAFILMGSFQFVPDNEALCSHLGCVARALGSGGLYLIENLLLDWVSPGFGRTESWEMREGDLTVKTTFRTDLADALDQTVQQTLVMEVDDGGERQRFVDVHAAKLFMPQEFRSLVELQGDFELVGFFERDSTQRLREISRDNVVLLRRR